MKLKGYILRRNFQHGKSFNFSIVRYLLKNGIPTHEVIIGLGTLRQADLKNNTACLLFWGRVNKAINKLKAANKLSEMEAADIKKKFEKIVPRNVAGAIVAPSVDLSKYKNLVETA